MALPGFKPFLQNAWGHKMLACLSLEFSSPWSSVPKLTLCGPFPRALRGETDETLHQAGIRYLLVERGDKVWNRVTGGSVAQQWYCGWVVWLPPLPGLCSFRDPTGCFTRSYGTSAADSSFGAPPSCFLAQAFFRSYREKGLGEGHFTINLCSPVSAHPE